MGNVWLIEALALWRLLTIALAAWMLWRTQEGLLCTHRYSRNSGADGFQVCYTLFVVSWRACSTLDHQLWAGQLSLR